ncbi:MAG TPA: cytochrome b/b6 domain-containing protein [Vicinamibacterales bacterium]|nr:cytochrome b/b6 domain-containing protein [Vicinamibacterales bacterium]
MDLVTWARSPWGEDVLTHISWSLLWASIVGGVLFLLAHGGYMLFSRHDKRAAGEVDRMEAQRAGLPARITRHTFVARMFHWVMAVAMLALVITAFVPIIGIKQFAWVEWHWWAGILLTGSILFHLVHATFFLDFWSIWVGPKDIPEFKAEMMRELGKEHGGPKPGKYPLGNRLYHLVVMLAGLAVIITGLLMMFRVRNPIVDRNPYLMGDPAWGITYVLHGLGGVGFVGLIMAHIYFALRPEKLWVTRSMLLGWITRREYLEHHDPDRWKTPTRPSPSTHV